MAAKVWKVQIFFNLIVNPTDKVVRTKPKYVVVLPMSNLINPKPNDNKNGQNGERKQFQSHSSGIIVLRTMLKFTIIAIQKSDSKNSETFVPTFMPGKYS